MEHEVFVPVPPDRLRASLADPAQVARAVPGLQRDAGAERPVAGRLRIRVGGHTITYRGELRVSPRDDDAFTVEGDATEARGTGTVTLALTLRVTEADGGSTLHVHGTATADGRITELEPDTVGSTTRRLLTRFAENLGAAEPAAPEAPEDPEAPDEPEQEQEQEQEKRTSVFEAEVPPPALDPLADDDFTDSPEPPAEAAHARRTMIGRSAEEVDHAPPRGRYAPVPAPQTVVPTETLRWAAPAAALVVASAIVVTKALRRRR
ncbi:SRPBCC family protein [Streptomyces longwoodensis]|uniref:SRPBCC family protein n=1 Tax=Streptomyces longwoodensis TaxID=68231 RepID=UPI0030E18DBA|nr:SRPBCC family protein [Streptomyces longwoodensis]